MAWQGLGDIINDFRKKTLGLSSLSLRSGPGIVERLRIPWTYAWSPALIPKPEDWMNHIGGFGPETRPTTSRLKAICRDFRYLGFFLRRARIFVRSSGGLEEVPRSRSSSRLYRVSQLLSVIRCEYWCLTRTRLSFGSIPVDDPVAMTSQSSAISFPGC